MELKNLIKEKVRFDFCRAGILYYIATDIETRDEYRFPVPLSDIGDATFLCEDKGILFMRYIRKAVEEKTIEQIRFASDDKYEAIEIINRSE